MQYQSLIRDELQSAASLLDTFLADPAHLQQIEKVADHLAQALNGGKKIITCGNGGSHCDAMHMAEELSGRYRENRRGLAAIAISDPSHITCVGNDFGFEEIFARYVEAVGLPGDVLVCISTSGNSANLVRAAERAHQQGITVVAFTGNAGGKLAGVTDLEIRIPYSGYADRIQEMHIKVIHILILLIEKMVN